jgi:hypothetical protein
MASTQLLRSDQKAHHSLRPLLVRSRAFKRTEHRRREMQRAADYSATGRLPPRRTCAWGLPSLSAQPPSSLASSVASSPPLRPRNHAQRFDKIPKLNLQAFEPQLPKPCNLKPAEGPKTDSQSTAWMLFHGRPSNFGGNKVGCTSRGSVAKPAKRQARLSRIVVCNQISRKSSGWACRVATVNPAVLCKPMVAPVGVMMLTSPVSDPATKAVASI